MAAIAVQRIQIYDTGQLAEPDVQAFPEAASQTYITGAVVILTSGNVSEAANNPATFLGLSIHDAVATYPANSVAPSASTLFGRTFVGTKLFPGEPGFQHVLLLHNAQQFEISLTQAWAASLVGTTAGLVKDATSGFWVLDNTQTNASCRIVQKSEGPSSFKGVVGDTFARVIAI